MAETEFEVNLIDCVRDHKVIYDKKVDGYRNKIAKTKAWEHIASLLNAPVENCIQTWNNLRSQYMAHRRKLKKPSGSSSASRPYFRREEAMQFLKDENESDGTLSNVLEDDEKEENAEEGSVEQSENDTTTPVQSPTYRTPTDYRSHQKKKRKMDSVDEEMIKLLKSEEDEFSAIGNLVAVKLRGISKVNRKVFVETESLIHSILNEAYLQILAANSEEQ